MNKSYYISALLFFLVLQFLTAQPKSNLDIIYDLIEENVNQILLKLPHDVTLKEVEFISPKEYENLENRFLHTLNNKGIFRTDSVHSFSLKYSLDQIGVLYSEPFRGSLLSDYEVERKIFLSSTFALGINNHVKHSEIIETEFSDTLYYSDIKIVETPNLSITHGTKPSEPLFESLLEPVIAIGVVIVTIILLFTVRSK
ncbi:MAG TPA: hypothetical protein ENN33_06165 [Ignavibacteria bacterium]|nr:hypothetical protein [Ignavibacteria bacterium]